MTPRIIISLAILIALAPLAPAQEPAPVMPEAVITCLGSWATPRDFFKWQGSW